MSYNSSSSGSNYAYLGNSKSSKLLSESTRERKPLDFSSKNRPSDFQRSENDNNSFLRSTMGSFSSRPNRQLFESAALQNDCKKQINLRHTTGNFADILKGLNFDKPTKEEEPAVGKKYGETSFKEVGSTSPSQGTWGGFKKEKQSYSTLYESKPSSKYETSENKKETSSKLNVDEILNKMKRQKELENEIKKLKEEKRLREQKQKERQKQKQRQRQRQKERQRQKSSKSASSSISSLLSSQSSSYSSSYKGKDSYNKNPQDLYNSYRKNNETYSYSSSTTDYEKKYEYDFSKKKNEYTPKREYDFEKKYEDITKKYDTTNKKSYDSYTTDSPLSFKKQTKTYTDTKYTSDIKYTDSKTTSTLNPPKQSSYTNSYTKSPVSSSKKQDNFSKYFSPSGGDKGEKFDCKVGIRDFKLGKTLGEGKFGVVYQALHKQTNSLYALKKVPKAVIKNHYMIDQFILQLKLQTFMHNEYLLALHGFFHDTENIYLILDYMEEGTLYSMLKKSKKLEYADAAKKIKEISKGIIYMHENGIAHRDIKPENVVMSHGSCKLCDFGWSTICDERRKTYCGTFDYAAPEILEGTEYDMSVDLWCLGVLAYQLLVGKAPFYHIKKEETKKKILNVESQPINYPAQMPREAVDFIQRLLKKDPEERIKNDELLDHPFLKNL